MTITDIVLAVFEGIVSIALMAAMPWAFVIERRLARIEANITEAIKGELKAIHHEISALLIAQKANENSVRSLDRRVMKIETKSGD